MPLFYHELRLMARRHMRRQPSGHTFQTTDLIHEAYLKIAGAEERNWQSRSHFFGIAAKAMRHILVLDCEAENWPTQDRSVTETNSIEFGVGEGTSALEDEDDLQPA